MISACPACVAVPTTMEVGKSARVSNVLSIPSMKCAACIRAVESALNGLAGVEEARVNLTQKRVHVEGNVDPERLVEVLRSVGFETFPFNYGKTRSAQDQSARDLLMRLGVAGFAMMNVMLLSVAVWSGAQDATRDLFHLVSAAIALPATIYAAKPFYANAWSAMRVWRVNMDVPISLAIVLAAGMSLYEALHGGAHAYFDAALSLTFFLLAGRYLEQRSRAAARSAAEDLSALEARTAELRCDGGYETVPIAQLLTGDVVLVATGVRVPVDGNLLDAVALTDRSFLTGESGPVTCTKNDNISAGEVNVGPPFHIKATAVGDDTNLRQMARLVETAEAAQNSYTSIADRAAAMYAPLVHALALLAFVGWYGATGDIRLALNIAIAVLIITCPCALGLAVPAVATAAIGKLYAKGVLVKSGTALERLAEVDHVFLDKTGTLTMPEVTVDADQVPERHRQIAKALAQGSRHPVSRALLGRLREVTAVHLETVNEVAGNGISGVYEGKPVALGRSEWLGGEEGGFALRVGSTLTPIFVSETLRLGAAKMVKDFQDLGLDVNILSGDNAAKTENLASLLGVERCRGWTAGSGGGGWQRGGCRRR